MDPEKFLVVIAGPTAVGKTAVAITVAKHFNTEVLSADSRQVFREMTIGTAKPGPAGLKEMKHHFIDSHSVEDGLNAGQFEAEAIPLIEKLFRKKNILVMAGGSGLYIDAVCSGFDPMPQADPDTRTQLNGLYETKGIEELRKMLKKLDPEHYKKVDLANPHRLLRALEVCLTTGKTYSGLRKGKKVKRDFSVIKTGLTVERKKLYARINARVDEMIRQGLEEEVRSLERYRGKNALNTVGYKEMFDHLDGKTSLTEAVELIKKNTRNFAKRQLTWFQRDKEIKWFDPGNAEAIMEYIDQEMKTA